MPLDLKDRSQQVLLAIVGSYIKNALPVGSRTVTKNFEFGLSAATIRNIMADLEEMGYLLQPHTSAGRVPTERGYRFYVDFLVSGDSLNWQEHVMLEEKHLFPKREDIRELFQETSQLLSFLTHYTGVVQAPNLRNGIFKLIEFIRLREGHYLVILVMEDGSIKNRTLEIDEDVKQEELTRFGELSNTSLSGRDLHEIGSRLLQEMEKEERPFYTRLLQAALELAQKAMKVNPESELYFGGTSNIINLPDFADLEKMRTLLTAIEEKAYFLDILNKCVESDGVQVFIGSENGSQTMENCSFVITTYKQGDQSIGTLGVLGPTRMEYERVIPIVEHTAGS